MTDLPQMMTPQEVAEYLKLSPKSGDQTVRRWARTKKLKGTKIGELWRFSREQVMDFMGGKK